MAKNPYGKGSRKSHGKSKRLVRKSHEFQGNQHTSEHSTEFTSASARKLLTSNFDIKLDEGHSYSILSFSLVFSALASMLQCKTCGKDVKFTKTGIRGLGFKINIECECGDQQINSCQLINTSFEINRRIVFVMRLLGIGRNGLDLFCALMDLTASFSKTTYYRLLENVQIAASSIGEICLKKAGEEEKLKNKEAGLPEDELVVSGDGTWSKRGFSSLLGVSTVIGKYSGKVLDFFVSSKNCKTCEIMLKKLNRVDFDIWYQSEHKETCNANYEGSSGGMEVQGIIEIFKNSIKLHNAKYAYYIGDGDSKTFTNLCNAKPYDDFVVEKLECVLHVGKRMFRQLTEVKKTITQLRKLKKAEEKKLEEQSKKVEKQLKEETPRKRRKMNKSDPPPSPAVKTQDLTGKIIKQMSIYYGLAIQRHPDSVANMQKEIWATFYHMISTDENPQHEFCDPDWCKFLKAQKEGISYTHKPALNAEVQEYVKPVFERLTNVELLKRCLGKNNQNNNECYNKTLWAIVPKHTFVGREVTELAANISLAIFNEGRMTLLKMLEVMGCVIGRFAYDWTQAKDDERISMAERASTAASREARLAKKSAQQEEEQGFIDSGVLLYGPGIAD